MPTDPPPADFGRGFLAVGAKKQIFGRNYQAGVSDNAPPHRHGNRSTFLPRKFRRRLVRWHLTILSAASGLWLAALLGGCAQPELLNAPPSPIKKEFLAEAGSRLGKHYWIRLPDSLCPAPTLRGDCVTRSEGGFTVEEVTQGSGLLAWVRVRFDNGAQGYMDYLPPVSWADRAGLSLKELERDMARIKSEYCTGGITLRLGMSEEDATRAWCFPDHVNSTETARGTREQWVYSGRGYLYFDNERLTSIQRVE